MLSVMRFKGKNLLGGVVFGAVFFLLGYSAGFAGFKLHINKNESWIPKVTINREVPSKHAGVNFSLFWKVWDRLDELYLDKGKLDQSKMVYGAISGMVNSLDDPYTVFLPPKENQFTKDDLSGSFEGVGIQLGYGKDNWLTVISPLEGTPASKAGVKPGDVIANIKDEANGIDRDTYGISIPEAVDLIRGPKGTIVELKIIREGEKESIDVKLKRETILVKSVELEFVDKTDVQGNKSKVAVLKLLRFGGRTDKEWEDAIARIKNEEKKLNRELGIVLDLRNNPGGYLDSSVWVASEFLKSGVVVKQENRPEIGTQEFDVDRKGRLLSEPLVVLVNRGTASAAEILAGAIRDNGRGKLVGEKTFGKGTVQQPEDLSGGAGIHVTIARWLLPSGENIHKVGIKPDVEIKNDEDLSVDEQLLKAVDLVAESN